MKNLYFFKINFLLGVLLIILFVLPKSVFAETIHLTQEDFDYSMEIDEPYKGIYHNNTGYVYLEEGVYQLDEDIRLDANCLIIDGADVSLNMDGHSLSVWWITRVENGYFHAYGGGEFRGNDEALESINSTLILDDITLQGLNTVNSIVTINGGINRGGFITSYHSNNDQSIVINNSTICGIFGLCIIGSPSVIIKDSFLLGLISSIIIKNDSAPSLVINGGNYIGGNWSILMPNINNPVQIYGGEFIADSNLASEKLKDLSLEKYENVVETLNLNLSPMSGALAVYNTNSNSDLNNYYLAGNQYKFSPNLISNYTADLPDPIVYFSNYLSFESMSFSQSRVSSVYDYKIIEGSNQSYLGNDIVVKVNGDMNLFEKIKINGQEIASNYYELNYENSTILLRNSYLSTLASGTYEISIVYQNGETSTNVFIMSNPKTSPKIIISVVTMAILLIFAFVALFIENRSIKKEKSI